MTLRSRCSRQVRSAGDQRAPPSGSRHRWEPSGKRQAKRSGSWGAFLFQAGRRSAEQTEATDFAGVVRGLRHWRAAAAHRPAGPGRVVGAPVARRPLRLPRRRNRRSSRSRAGRLAGEHRHLQGRTSGGLRGPGRTRGGHGRGGHRKSSPSTARGSSCAPTRSAPTPSTPRALNECPCQASVVRYSRADRGDSSRILFTNPDNAGAPRLEIACAPNRSAPTAGPDSPVRRRGYGPPGA